MAISVSFGTLSSLQGVGTDAPRDDTPFRVVVLGDFSGRGIRGELGDADEIARRRPRKVDRGTVEELLARFKTHVPVPVGAGGLPETIEIRSLDHFHPDGLVSRVEAFRDAFDQEEKSELLSKILHDPGFQSLEATWRGLDWLLQSAANDKGVEFKVVDLSPEELRADLSGAETLEATGLYQVLVDQPAQRGEMDPWTVIVGLYTFEPSTEDVSLLGKIARIARQASAPFLAAASPAFHAPKFALDETTAEAWTALRKLPEAALLALTAPRFLLRPPYGENTRTIDAFEYEESNNRAGWKHYLWGNPSLATAYSLIRSFVKENWALRPGSVLDLTGMSMHVVKDEDDEPLSVMAEALLTPPVSKILVDIGVIPLLSVRGRDQLSLFGVHSLAQPPRGERTSPLVGRWGHKGAVQLPGGGKPAVAAPHQSSPEGVVAAQVVVTAPAATAPSATEDSATDDPELAALLADLDSPTAAEAEPEEPLDPELAALLADLETPAEPAPPAEPEIDPELAALLADLENPAVEPEDEEVDPELAALLADLDSPAAEPAAAEATPAESEVDPELAALLADLENSASPDAPPAIDQEVDPELAALLAELDSPGTPEPVEEPPDDPELAALLAELE